MAYETLRRIVTHTINYGRLTFTAGEWIAFTTGICAGEFD
jgi:hypothetical protein